MNVRISPSQLGFVYESCPRCLWLYFRKVVAKRDEERFAPFNLLDKVQQSLLPVGTSLRELGIPGEVAVRTDWVTSRSYGGGGVSFQILGKYDLLARLDEGGFAVVDLKTAKPDPKKAAQYRNQLSAYALALLEPERFGPVEIRATYLCHWWAKAGEGSYQPDAEPPTIVTYFGGHGVEVAMDLEGVREAMATVAAIASEEFVPDMAESCPNCNYVRDYSGQVRASRERRREREGRQEAGRAA